MNSKKNKQEVIVPIEQDTILFNGKALIVVQLPDGRVAAVLNSFCDNLQIDPSSQRKRILRTEAIAGDLVNVQIDRKPEDGGPQAMAALIMQSIPFWLAGVDANRVREEIRPDLIRYQREVAIVLYKWAEGKRMLSEPATSFVPMEPTASPLPTKPIPPERGAPLEAWRQYHMGMLELLDWQAETDQWREGMETRVTEIHDRLENVESVTGFIPEILDRLGPPTLTPQHQRQVQIYAKQLHETKGLSYSTIYENLRNFSHKPRYQEILEEEWPHVEEWFQEKLGQIQVLFPFEDWDNDSCGVPQRVR